MSCGCHGASTKTDRVRTSMLMCWDCPHLGECRHPRCPTMTVQACTIGGRPVPIVAAKCAGRRAMAITCGAGRHPDERGVVVWLEMEWIGVPWPLRLLHQRPLRWLTRHEAYLSPPPGCGCLLQLKRVWVDYVVALFRGRAQARRAAFGDEPPPWTIRPTTAPEPRQRPTRPRAKRVISGAEALAWVTRWAEEAEAASPRGGGATPTPRGE